MRVIERSPYHCYKNQNNKSLTQRRARILAALLLIALIVSPLSFVAAEAQAGDLDPASGSGGRVLRDVSLQQSRADATAIQNDGRIIVAGGSFRVPTGRDFAIARYNPGGTLDPTFGVGGKVFTDFGSPLDGVTAITIQPDGRIIAAGTTETFDTGENFALARYNSDGTLDLTFGAGGKVTTDFASGNDRASAVTLQPDGRIVVAGTTFNAGTETLSDFALARYNPDGTLDATFGVGGKVTTDLSGNSGEDAAPASSAAEEVSLMSHIRFDPFNVCLEDGASGNRLQFSSRTGRYIFSNCSGVSVTGTGTLTIKGRQILLTDVRADRIVQAKSDGASGRGVASIQMVAEQRLFTIADRSNDGRCSCE
jgi:uncharacterized delta-60 repeat protein